MSTPSTPDTPLTREALLAIFCVETRERLGRALENLQAGPESCDYEAVHQEFDSLHGGARAVDLPWLEHYSRVLAGYARFLRHLRQNRSTTDAHELLHQMVGELNKQCQRTTLADLMAGAEPDPFMSGLMRNMQNLLREADPAEFSPCAQLAGEWSGDRPPVLLVVDDSATSRLLFRIHLPPEAGCTLHEAEDAEGALALALAHQPDVVFLDYNMPDTNGVAIAQRMRGAGLAPCFILLTANVQQAVLDEARAAGFAGVLEKPVNRSRIAAILQASRQD